MVSYTNPQIPLLKEPVGLDAVIQDVQLALSEELPWLQCAYGKSYRASTDNKNFYPEVYAGQREYQQVTKNDNVASQCFFAVMGSGTSSSQEPGEDIQLTYPVDVVFIAHLTRIDAAATERFEERLKRDALRALNSCPGVLVRRVYDAPADVFRGYAVDYQAQKHPWASFRVSMELTVENASC